MCALKINDGIRIILSATLLEMKLGALVGAEGVITACFDDDKRKNRGCMVMFHKSFEGHYIWFIPIDSIELCEH